MHKEAPAIFINGLIGCLDHYSLHEPLPEAGQLMMIEQPHAFAQTIAQILDNG